MAVAAPARAPAQPERKGLSLEPYLYILPVAISTLIFTVGPAIFSIYISFTNWSFRHFQFSDITFIGLDNYKEMFDTSQGGGIFLPVLGWTLVWTIFTSLFNVAGGMLLALALNNPRILERNLYRVILVIPWALPVVLTAQMWAGLLNTQGVFNMILGTFHLGPVKWLQETNPARSALLIVNLWLSYPYFMTVFLAALQAIPVEMFEAADLDGATSFQKFRFLTFPFLLSSTLPLLVSQLAFQFTNFNVIFLLTGGNPIAFPGADYGVTDTLSTFVYKLIFSLRRYGLAAAYGMAIFAFVAVLTWVNTQLTGAFRD